MVEFSQVVKDIFFVIGILASAVFLFYLLLHKFGFIKTGANLFLGPNLIRVLKQLSKEIRDKSVNDETIATVGAHIIWRFTRIGIFAILIALIPFILLYQQNGLLQKQNEKFDLQNSLIQKQGNLLENQNQSIIQQNKLIEAERRSSLIFLMSNVLDKVDEEIQIQKEKFNITTENDSVRYSLSGPLIGRIAALSRSFRPYQFLQGDTLIKKPVSPERGQLLIALISSHLDSITQEEINDNSDFSFADLANANLYGANLNYITLDGADLQNATLSNASIKDADLSEANLENADLTEADLSDTYFDLTNLKGANLEGAILDQTDFDGTVLVEAKFNGANITDSGFDSADLKKAEFEKTIIKESEFIDVDLTEANFHLANIENIKIEDAKIEKTKFGGATLIEVSFLNTSLIEVNFWGTKLFGVDFNEADLIGVNFSQAHLPGTNLSYKDLNSSIFKGTVFREDNITTKFDEIKNYPATDLRGTNFCGIDLSLVNLEGLNLSNADLSFANLSDAYLYRTNLSHTNLNQTKSITVDQLKWAISLYQCKNLAPSIKQQLQKEKPCLFTKEGCD